MSHRPSTLDNRSWERLQFRGAPIKLQVLADLPASTAPLLADRAWHSFKQHCAEDGDLIPRLLAELEPHDPGMFQRRGPRRPKGSDPFSDLPPAERLKAEETFRRLCRKWQPDLPSWRRAILAGRARRLTLHPPDSEWGKRMRRIKGGVHCQRKYRELGGHPLEAHNQTMTKRRKAILNATEEGKKGVPNSLTPLKEARNRLGITSDQMKRVERIAPILESAGCSFERAVNALRWSQDEDARRFLQKYDSIPLADRKHLTIDEICVAANVDPRRLLMLVAGGMMWISAMMATIQVATSLPKVTKAMIRSALTKRGDRDRRLFFELSRVPFAQTNPGKPAIPYQNGFGKH